MGKRGKREKRRRKKERMMSGGKERPKGFGLYDECKALGMDDPLPWGDDDDLLDTGAITDKVTWALTPRSGSGKFVRCYESHPALELRQGLVIYGGSCISPVVNDAKVYIGFDSGMTFGRAMPWAGGLELLVKIQDRGVPNDVGQFSSLVEWTARQIEEGRKVHVGCIGGHGRTGMFLAALYSVMSGDKSAIEYVRSHYCKKVVESQAQVDFLVKCFGVNRVEPTDHAYKSSKAHSPYSGYGSTKTSGAFSSHSTSAGSLFDDGYRKAFSPGLPKKATYANSNTNTNRIGGRVKTAGDIWGDTETARDTPITKL